MEKKSAHHHSGHDHSALITLLLECARVCEKCMSACLEEDNVTDMAHCIEQDRDCAAICFLGARLLMRDATMAHQFLMICEKACRDCAEECSKHMHQHCKECAVKCMECAEACHAHHGKLAELER